MRKLELKLWEAVVILLCGILFFVSLLIYFTGFPLRNYLFSLKEDPGAVRIGQLKLVTGPVRREIVGQTEFTLIPKGSVLFMKDTIVTGNESTATIALDDGTLIELGPKTMVKLEEETNFSFTGV